MANEPTKLLKSFFSKKALDEDCLSLGVLHGANVAVVGLARSGGLGGLVGDTPAAAEPCVAYFRPPRDRPKNGAENTIFWPFGPRWRGGAGPPRVGVAASGPGVQRGVC